MKSYSLDYETSKVVYDIMQDKIEVKACYNNVWNVATNKFYRRKFKKGEWRIAYGGMPSIDGTYVRHCFIVTNDDKVIDPTIFAADIIIERDKGYIAHTVFKDWWSYFNAIMDNDNSPDLYMFLRNKDKQMFEELQKQNLFYLGW